jgi:hypothetical protein
VSEVDELLEDIRSALAGIDAPSDEEIAATARARLPEHGFQPRQEYVDFCVDAIKRGPRRAAVRATLRGIREIYDTCAGAWAILKQGSVPSFLNVPRPSERAEWGWTSVDWLVQPVLALDEPEARSALTRILAEAPLHDPPSRRSFPVWFKPGEPIDVMAGRTRIGSISEPDRARLRRLVADAATRKHVLEADAYTNSASLDDLTIEISLPDPDARQS